MEFAWGPRRKDGRRPPDRKVRAESQYRPQSALYSPFFHLTHNCCSIHPRLTRYISSPTMFAIASSSRLTLGRLAILGPARTRLYVAATKPPSQEASPSASSESPSPAKAGEPQDFLCVPTCHFDYLLTSFLSLLTSFSSTQLCHHLHVRQERPCPDSPS